MDANDIKPFPVDPLMEASEIRERADAMREGDPAVAAELYRQASDMGDARASSSLGYMHLVGEGVPQDTDAAKAYLGRAAELGDAKAMCNLGSVLMGEDPAAALELFERAGGLGYVTGMVNAATMLRGGSGVPADPGRAVEWLSRASETNAEAAGILAHILRTGEGVPEDKPRAAELYRRAAEAGDPDSQYDLAMMLDAGDGIPADRTEAERWFRASAEQGDNDARLCLGGILYERGDFAGAETVFTDAALDGDVKAMYNLATMYADGTLGEPDMGKAREWLEEASEKGFAYAQSMLGAMLIDGEPERAAELLRKAADQGEPMAMYNLAAMALSGRIRMDEHEAVRLLVASAEAGVGEARELLSKLSSMGALRSLVPVQDLQEARDLAGAREAVGHEAVGPPHYDAVDPERQRGAGVVGAVPDHDGPVAGHIEPRERQLQGLRVRLVVLGVVPADYRLGDVAHAEVGHELLDLVAHLPRHDGYVLPALLQRPQRRLGVRERVRVPVGVRRDDVEEPGAILRVRLGAPGVGVEDVVHGHPEVPGEVLPSVGHADDRQHGLQDRVDARAGVEQRVVEVEEVEVVLPHLVPT